MRYITYVKNNKTNLFWTINRYIRYFISATGIYLSKSEIDNYKQYKISVCAIFRNENIYLKEWIEYHLLIGIEHFYLYNNFSTDDYQNTLQSYIDKNIITLIDWPLEYGQVIAYEDCYEKYSKKTEWIAYIDIDEFIYLHNDIKITDWIMAYKNYPSVFINWKMFGTSGKITHKPKDLIIETNTSCWPELCNAGKSIINTNFKFDKFTNPHIFNAIYKFLNLKITLLPVNEFKKYIYYWMMRYSKNDQSQIQINHYYYKSIEHYKKKISTDACSEDSRKKKALTSVFKLHEERCTDKDICIQKHLEHLKEKI